MVLTHTDLTSAIIRHPLLVAPDQRVVDVIAQMSEVRSRCSWALTQDLGDPMADLHLEARSSCVLVVDNGQLIGIVTERDIVRLSAQQQSLNLAVSQVMTSPVVSLRESAFTDIFSAVYLLQQRRIRHIPLLNDHDQIVGLVTHESLRQLSRPLDLLRLRLVSEVMTPEVVCAVPQVSMLTIAQLMVSHHVGSILLVRDEISRNAENPVDEQSQALRIPLGIITERDIVQFQSLGLDLATVQAEACMSTPVFSIKPEESLWAVHQIMAQRLIRRLIVTGTQGEVLGIITQTSILNALDPLELYSLTEILGQRIVQLEAEKIKLLENHTAELERQVEQRMAEVKAKTEREQLIAAIASQIRSSLYLPQVLETTAVELRSLLDCNCVAIWQFQPDGSTAVVAESLRQDGGSVSYLHRRVYDPCFAPNWINLYRQGHVRVVPDIYTTDMSDCHRELLEGLQIRAKILVPIIHEDTLWGMLSAIENHTSRTWQPDDVMLMQQLATQLAIAIQQATAYQQAQIELAERQRTEAALRESEQRLRAIFNSLFQFIGLLTPDGTVLEVNQIALATAGIESDQVVGRPFWETHWWQISPETQAQLQAAIARAAQGHLVHYEVEVWGIYQTIIPLDFSLHPIFDQDDRVVLMISEGKDLRKLKHRERELSRSEQRFASLASAAPVGIFRTDDRGNCLYVNERWSQIAGLTPDQAAGFGWVNGIHPDDRELVSAEWDAALQANRPFSLEYRFLNAVGQVTWVYGQSVAERDEAGVVVGYIGTITDISERKQREAKSRAMLEAIPDLMFCIGADGIYRELGGLRPKIDLLAGRDRVGLAITDLLPTEVSVRYFHAMEQALRTGELQVYEQEVLIGDRLQIEEVRVAMVSDNEFLFMIRDVSDRKAAERALQVQGDCNQRVAEITSRFVDLNPDALDAEIERTLQVIGEMISVDTSYLMQLDQGTSTITMTHEWSQRHCPRQIALVQNLPLSISPWSTDILMQRGIVQVPCVADLPAVAAIDQATWQQFNIVALLAIPLIQKSTVVGFIGFASFSQTIAWDQEIVRLLQIIAQTIANARQRAQDEEQIKESEERLRLALSAANQGLYDLNLQTGEAIVSAEYALMLGYDPATFEETYAKWIERLHPDDRDAVVSLYHNYVAGNLSDYEVEFRQRTRTGVWKWIFSKGKIVAWDEAGNPLRMLGTQTDISDRKQAEEQAQHRLDILEAARDIISSASSTGQVSYLNQAARELLGIDPDADILQTFITDYHPPEIAELILQDALPQCAQQGFWAGETQFLRHDGSNFPAWQVIVAHRHQDGSISHFSTIARDLTNLKQAEAERLQAEKLRGELTLLENILDIILAGYWDWNIPANEEYLSPGFKQMFGYADDELPNSPESWQQLIFEEDLPGVLACFDRHVQSHGEVPFYNEVRYRHKNGSTIWVLSSGQVIEWGEAGQPIRMIGCHIDITQRKQAEQQLRKSDAHLKTAQRIGKLGSWEFDHRTEQISWSDEVYRIFGRDPDAGPPSFEELQNYLHPNDRIPHQQAIQTTIETRQPYDIEFCIYRPDGTLRCLQVRGEPIIDAQGQLIQLVGTVLDISDRKQGQIALEESQRLLQTVLDSFPLAVFWKDRQSVILGCNQFFAQASGMTSPLEMIGKDAFDLPYSAEEALKYHEDDRAVMESGLSQIGIQETITSANGQVQWVETNKIPLRNSFGEVVGIVGTFQDITNRKQAEEKLRNISDRLTLAIKSAAIAIWDWYVPDNILIWDDRMYELYGITPDRFTNVYDAWANSLHPEDRSLAETAIQQALLGEKDYDPEFRVIHPDGTISYIKAYALVQRNDQGEPQHMIGINIDITDRKLAEIQLLQTTAQLEASNRELEAFAYSVSHDLRSPLRAIDGFSKALLEDYGDQFDEEGKDYFDRIRSNVSRMGMLIDDLLRLSRVSRSEMKYTIINLSTLVQEQLDDLRAADPQRQVTTIIAPGAIVSADTTLMRVVLSNLLQNAWKFTSHHDTARIEFGIMPTDTQPIYFVRDDGAGFDMAYAKMLFRVFQRLHNTNEFPGTGIGLATVQRAIHRHGGQVWAEGAVEQGATVYFTVPTTPNRLPPSEPE